MTHLRLAVVGAGHLGRFHAKLVHQLDDVELVAVVDPFEESRTRVAQEVNCEGLASHETLLDSVDGVIIATPTHCHRNVSEEFLSAGVHVFVEKPITTTLEEADALIATADKANCVLQVGHIERFNPAVQAATPYVSNPKYIEATRASGYTFRSIDVGVVLDLMIHDIDVVLSLVRSPLVDVQAMGLAIFGPEEDVAQARLTFENGCVANLSASRCSYDGKRAMQIYAPDGFAAIDFANRTVTAVRPSARMLHGEINVNEISPAEREHIKEHLFDDLLAKRELVIPETNPLLDEQRDFVNAIRLGKEVQVTGRDGRDALAVAHRILASISAHCWNGADESPLRKAG